MVTSFSRLADIDCKIAAQRAAGSSVPFGLATDIDRTFWLQEGTLLQRHRYLEATQRLVRYVRERNYPLIAVTARDFPMMFEGPLDGVFDMLLLSLGSERYVKCGSSYALDREYRQFIEGGVGGWREAVYPACRRFLEAGRHLVPQASLHFQPRDSYANVLAYDRYWAAGAGATPPRGEKPPQPYKISFTFYGDQQVTELLRPVLERELVASGVARVRSVFSIDSMRAGRIRNNIDVVPVDKGVALGHTLKELQARHGEMRWIYAGDSSNDASPLLRSGSAGILVGGYTPDLARAVDEDGYTNRRGTLGLGRENRLLYRETNPLRRGPESVLAGLQELERELGGP